MERISSSTSSEPKPTRTVGSEFDLPPPRPLLPDRMGRSALSDLDRIREIRVVRNGFRSSKTVFVTEAGRARVVEKAQRPNREREQERTQDVLDAAAKAKLA